MSVRRTVFLLVVAAGVTLATSYGFYHLGIQRGSASANVAPSSARTPIAASKAGDIDPSNGKKILYWHDPMMPGQRFDRPGKSPFMDMQLVPVYAEDGNADSDGVSISGRVQQNLGVRTAPVRRAVLAQAVEAVGSVAYNERDVAVVQARSTGFIERLYVRAPLDPVRRGQPLAEVYVPEWVAAQEEYLAAKRIARKIEGKPIAGLVDGARQRMRLSGMSEAQIQRVEAGDAVVPRMTLVAPIGGVVTELGAREGMTVMPGAALFRINGLGTVWVNAEVPESLAAYVRPGNGVAAKTAAMPDVVFKGKVSAILPEVSTATRTLKARVELANPGGRLVPGMFTTVDFAPRSAEATLLVPSEAVIRTGKRTLVIVARGGGTFAPVEVEAGGESNGETGIRKGLTEGQEVVTSAQFLIDSEASLRASANRLAGGTSPAAPAASAPQAPTHKGTGRIEAIDGGEMTLSHGPIASLQWPAMTMGFALADPALARGFAVGQTVEFEFGKSAGGEYRIVALRPTAIGGSASAAAVPAHDHGAAQGASTGGKQ